MTAVNLFGLPASDNAFAHTLMQNAIKRTEIFNLICTHGKYEKSREFPGLFCELSERLTLLSNQRSKKN